MNKIFIEKFVSKLNKGMKEINSCLDEVKISIRMQRFQKSSNEPLNISFVIISEIKKDKEILQIISQENFHTQYINVIRLFKKSFNSARGKNKKISISFKIIEYEDILKAYKRDTYIAYSGGLVFIEGYIYNPADEALNLLSKF